MPLSRSRPEKATLLISAISVSRSRCNVWQVFVPKGDKQMKGLGAISKSAYSFFSFETAFIRVLMQATTSSAKPPIEMWRTAERWRRTEIHMCGQSLLAFALVPGTGIKYTLREAWSACSTQSHADCSVFQGCIIFLAAGF